MGLHHSPKIATSNLAIYLDAANSKSYPGSGSTWNDLRGTYNGTLYNAPTHSNKLFTFDGVNEYHDTLLDLSWNNTNSVTICATVKPASTGANHPFIGKGPFNWEWQLMQVGTSLQFVYWNTGGGHTNGPIPLITNFFVDTNYVILCMVWNHVDNKYYFYRNSVLVNTTTWTDASINQNRTDTVNLGGSIYQWGLSGSYWNGSIAQFSAYSRALSSTEVLQNFNAIRGRYGL